jgi:hypothetical protein
MVMDRYQVETAAALLKQIRLRLELRTRAANTYSLKSIVEDYLSLMGEDAMEDAKDAVMAVMDRHVKEFIDGKLELIERTGLVVTQKDLNVMEAEQMERHGFSGGLSAFDRARKVRMPLIESEEPVETAEDGVTA